MSETNPRYKGTYKGRFEFIKDIRSFYLSVAHSPAFIKIQNIIYNEDFNDVEVEFSIWYDGEYTIEHLLDHMELVSNKVLAKSGIETHVFRQSVKLIDEYDGERNARD
jgi:hypothetical protein